MSLFKEFWKNKSEIGSIAPSSPFLTRKMLKPVDFSRSLVIVEYGPGTGAFTLPLLKRMNSRSLLISIESNRRLYRKLQPIQAAYSNFKIVHDSAENIDRVLCDMALTHVDYIISSLPLAVISEPEKTAIISKARACLFDHGLYIQYQYTLDAHGLLSSAFKKVKCGFSMMNIPPAFVYYCAK